MTQCSPVKDDLRSEGGDSENNGTPVVTPSHSGKKIKAVRPKSSTDRSSCKRRRLVSNEDEENEHNGPVINFTTMRAKKLEFDDEDCDEMTERLELYQTIRRHIQELNAIEDDEELLHSSHVKLYEFINGHDIVSEYYANSVDHFDSYHDIPPPRWVERGYGQIKFLKQLEDSVHQGTVHIVMYHGGSRRMLVNHSVDPELEVRRLEAKSTHKKQKPSYVWTTTDHADYARDRTFAVKFRSELEAIEWKDWFERSKNLTRIARLGIDSQDTRAGDEMCSYMANLSTVSNGTTPSPKKQKRDHVVISSK